MKGKSGRLSNSRFLTDARPLLDNLARLVIGIVFRCSVLAADAAQYIPPEDPAGESS